MNKFLLQFYLIILGILLFVGGVLFLLFNHADTLYQYVPAEAENYLHIQPQALKGLSEEQRTEIYGWLKNHSSITEDAWKNILESNERELALFSLNGQLFGVAKNFSSIKVILTIHNLSYTENNKALYFPSLTINTQNTLIQQSWFKQVHQKICFKDFVFYSHNLNTLQLNTPLLKNTNLPTIIFLGDFDENKITMNVLGSVGQAKNQNINAPIKNLPASTISYFRNLQVTDLATFNAVTDSLELLIIQKLKGSIEYFKDHTGSQVKITKDSITLEQMKKVALSSLAQLYPARKNRILPDGTVAINLIADEQAWEFIEFSPSNWILQEKNLTEETKLKLNLQETETNYLLTFEAPVLAGTNTSKCKLPKFSQNGLIYTQTSNQYFKNILIQNKNQNKLSICID